tara:strand:+ start:1096 stop:1770 length:675 start_codon:yes stop_codon:yes gene_type:complete
MTRNHTILIKTLFNILSQDKDTALSRIEIFTKHKALTLRGDSGGELPKPIISSFCEYQKVLGNLRGDNRKNAKKTKFFKLSEQGEKIIQSSEEEIFYTTEELKRNLEIIRDGERRDFRNIDHDEMNKLLLTFRWIPTHVVIDGRIFEIIEQNNTIKLKNCINHSKSKKKSIRDKFSCEINDDENLERYELNLNHNAYLACDGDPIPDESLKDPILLKIENESQS